MRAFINGCARPVKVPSTDLSRDLRRDPLALSQGPVSQPTGGPCGCGSVDGERESSGCKASQAQRAGAGGCVSLAEVGGERNSSPPLSRPGLGNARYAKCLDCMTLQEVGAGVCGVCEADLEMPSLSALDESRGALAMAMIRDGWRREGPDGPEGESRWSKTVRGAECMVANPSGIMRRRVTKEVSTGRVVDDLVVHGHTSPKRLCTRLRGPKDLEVTVEVVPLDGLDDAAEDTWDDMEMDSGDATRYRAVTARLNYYALDRPDLLFAAKECSRSMAKPVNKDWAKVKRVARYLVGARDLAHHFRWQDAPAQITAYSDSDWAGCAKTRKSTSGACCLVGSHLVKAYSRTQSNIALSSGEAELYGMVA